MRRRYRSTAGIVLDLLRCSEDCDNVSCLATCANLPYDRAKEMVEKLKEKGFLDDDLNLTPAGRKAMEKLLETKRLLEALGFKL